MILQLNKESGHPLFRASSAFERGDLSKRHGKNSTLFNENERNIELLLRTVISVNQLSIHGATANLCKELNGDSDGDSHEDSESSGTFDTEERPNETEIWCLKNKQDAHLTETHQSLRPIRPEHQQRQCQDLQFEGGENFDYDVDRKTGWRYYREPRRNPPEVSSSSTSQWKTSWSSWQPTSFEKWWWFRFPGRYSRKLTEGVDWTPTHNTHLCSAVSSQARNAHTTRLAQELHYHLCAPEKSLVIWCVSCLTHGCSLTRLPPWALPHLHLSILPHTENTQYITHISKLPQSTSCAIKNHSGVKTCRVAETRAPQLPLIEDTSTLWNRPKSECPDIWIRPPRHKWPKSWSSVENPVVLLERNLYGHPCRIIGGKTSLKNLVGTRMEKCTEFGMPVCSSTTRPIPFGKLVWQPSGWKKAKPQSYEEEIVEKRWSWRTWM